LFELEMNVINRKMAVNRDHFREDEQPFFGDLQVLGLTEFFKGLYFSFHNTPQDKFLTPLKISL
jgi:hypothetical protein